MKQGTIDKPVRISDRNPRNVFTHALLKPAPEDYGITFVSPYGGAHAHIDNAVEKTFGVSLRGGNGKVVVRVVEHWLAALYALDIDNLRIELSSDMPPIFDGSVVKLITALKGRVVRQDKERPVKNPHWTGRDRFGFYSRGGPDRLTAAPAQDFALAGVFNHPKAPFAGTQAYTWDGRLESFETDLAPARTNVLLNRFTKIPFLAAAALGLHNLNESTSLISYGNRWENESRYGGDEPVRHFVLDRIGALALLPYRLRCHLTFERTGHSFDIEALRALHSEISW